LNADTYVEDGDYIKDIEINDLRNRYMLTKGSTQKMVIPPAILLAFQTLFCRPTAFPLFLSCVCAVEAYTELP
jgi:hypothetical protein